MLSGRFFEIFGNRRYLDAEKDTEKILDAIRNGDVSDIDISDDDEEKESLQEFNALENITWDSNESAADRQNWTTQEYVSLFWDTLLMEMSKYTKMKYHKETVNVLNICLNDMKAYLGATLLMSRLGYPRVCMYFQKTTRVPAIANAITRNKYFQIRNHLKVLDDAQVTDEKKNKDKLWKVRPIMDRVRKGCLTLPRSKNLAVDEQMIPLIGVCAVKRYVPGKPNPEGLRNFVLAAPSGLVLDFEVYKGKGIQIPVQPSAIGRRITLFTGKRKKEAEKPPGLKKVDFALRHHISCIMPPSKREVPHNLVS
ncbi:piggyBac transposable element-derived protein 3-like [Stegodyphus dumicola]|uniref:piggyBac transposable element-derived protein 3-like n=1 Tax=Stegodyphus dumicola TaxID=202533 RepID=UPI0015AF5D95|nr:piggyBac transposable element-derived protein 3-like [Stegodyphus dumicola]